MPTASPVIPIPGAGPNIGQSVARVFAAKGYRVAVASRKATGSPDQLHIPSDFSNPSAVGATFAKVKDALGIPSVASIMVRLEISISNLISTLPLPANSHLQISCSCNSKPTTKPLSVSVSDFTEYLTIKAISTFAAAQAVTQGFERHILNTDFIIPPLLDLGVGKSAKVHIVHSTSTAYKNKGYKHTLFYADERKPNGDAVYSAIDGNAHAKHYVDLAKGKVQGPWQQNFAKGVKYKAFKR